MKMVGTNIILGRTLGVCFATTAVIPRSNVMASIRAEHSIESGKSHFFAELERILSFVQMAAAPAPLFVTRTTRLGWGGAPWGQMGQGSSSKNVVRSGSLMNSFVSHLFIAVRGTAWGRLRLRGTTPNRAWNRMGWGGTS